MVRFPKREEPHPPALNVFLVSTIWSTCNAMTIESGTRGQVVEVGSRIKVQWSLPYYQSPLCDLFTPQEYEDYFEEL